MATQTETFQCEIDGVVKNLILALQQQQQQQQQYASLR